MQLGFRFRRDSAPAVFPRYAPCRLLHCRSRTRPRCCPCVLSFDSLPHPPFVDVSQSTSIATSSSSTRPRATSTAWRANPRPRPCLTTSSEPCHGPQPCPCLPGRPGPARCWCGSSDSIALPTATHIPNPLYQNPSTPSPHTTHPFAFGVGFDWPPPPTTPAFYSNSCSHYALSHPTTHPQTSRTVGLAPGLRRRQAYAPPRPWSPPCEAPCQASPWSERKDIGGGRSVCVRGWGNVGSVWRRAFHAPGGDLSCSPATPVGLESLPPMLCLSWGRHTSSFSAHSPPASQGKQRQTGASGEGADSAAEDLQILRRRTKPAFPEHRRSNRRVRGPRARGFRRERILERVYTTLRLLKRVIILTALVRLESARLL